MNDQVIGDIESKLHHMITDQLPSDTKKRELGG